MNVWQIQKKLKDIFFHNEPVGTHLQDLGKFFGEGREWQDMVAVLIKHETIWKDANGFWHLSSVSQPCLAQ